MLGAGQDRIASIVVAADEVRSINPASISVPSFTVARSSGQLGTDVGVGVREAGAGVGVGVRVAVAGREVGVGVDVG